MAIQCCGLSNSAFSLNGIAKFCHRFDWFSDLPEIKIQNQSYDCENNPAASSLPKAAVFSVLGLRVKRIHVWWPIAQSPKTQHILPFFFFFFFSSFFWRFTWRVARLLWVFLCRRTQRLIQTTNSFTSSPLLRWLRISSVESRQEWLVNYSARSCCYVQCAVCISQCWLTLPGWMPHMFRGVSVALGSVASMQAVAIRCRPGVFLKPRWLFCFFVVRCRFLNLGHSSH